MKRINEIICIGRQGHEPEPTTLVDHQVQGLVLNIMRFSIQDGPGVRTTVFFKGCPLRCLWCHNPESQSFDRQIVWRRRRCLGCQECALVCPTGATMIKEGRLVFNRQDCQVCGQCAAVCPTEARDFFGREMSPARVMDEILKDRAFYEESGGGVTFSGGEPLAQPDFLYSLLTACALEEIHTVVDTAGAAPFEVFERINPYVDLYLYDLKIMDKDRHREAVGTGNRLILENLTRLIGLNKKIWIRMPLIPGYTDSDENIEALGSFLAGLPRTLPLVLLPYHGTGVEKYELLGRRCAVTASTPVTSERLEEITARLRNYGLPVTIGG